MNDANKLREMGSPLQLIESRVDNAHYATNRAGQRGRGRGGFRGRGGRGNFEGPRGGGVNQYAPKQEGANLETPPKNLQLHLLRNRFPPHG